MLAIGNKLLFTERSRRKKRTAKPTPIRISPTPTKGRTHHNGNACVLSELTIFEKIIEGSKTLITIIVSPFTSAGLKTRVRTNKAPIRAISNTCIKARVLLDNVVKNISVIKNQIPRTKV